jgi:hypothetical protein
MTTRIPTADKPPRHEAAVWIDHDQAVIVEHAPDGQETVERLDRTPQESEAAFEVRTVDQVLDQDVVVVSGPAYARTGFERAYVAVTHRPDRIVDVEPVPPPACRIRRTA